MISNEAQRYYQQGCDLQLAGQQTAALDAFLRALELDPGLSLAHLQVGQLYLEAQNDLDLAQAAFEKALKFNPQCAPAYYHLGQVQYQQGKPVSALQNWQRYLQFQPEDSKVQLEIGDLLAELGKKQQANNRYLKASSLAPQNQEALDRQVQAEISQNPLQFYQLMQVSEQTFPNESLELARNLAFLLENKGFLKEARECYGKVLASPQLPDRLAWELKQDLLVPVFPSSQAQQLHYLEKTRQSLIAWENRQLPAAPPIQTNLSNLGLYLLNWVPLENMAYSAYNPAQERRRLGQVLHKLLPPQAPLRHATLRKQKRRIGFVLSASGAVLKFMVGLLQRLPTNIFEIYILHTDKVSAAYFSAERLQPQFQYHLLQESPRAVVQQIRDLELDILYLTEPNAQQGMQSLLASFRLAPVQVTSWLSSGTTGQPHLDYFLSSELVEPPENPAQYYTERLVLQKTLPTYFFRPPRVRKYQRSDYGLPETGQLYLCPHLMHKIQPDFETLMAEILRADPEGHLVLLTNPNNEELRGLLLQRFEQNIPELMSRIWFLPYLKSEEYLNLLEIGDVSLDPLYFGGGTTSYEALGSGIPMITLPDPERLHGRVTLGCYRKMGLEACIAKDRQDYVQKALAIASDKKRNAEIRAEILAQADQLFEDQAAVSELCEFLSSVSLRA